MEDQFNIRKQIVEIGRRMYDREMVAASDGNISYRLSDREIIITPTGSCLGFLRPTQLVTIDPEGRPLFGSGRPTSEFRLHLEVYRRRPEVRAVVHAHPIFCTAFSVAGITLDQCVIPEVVFTLGAIPTTAYATPTTDEPPRVIREYIENCDALILDRHGTLTVGETLSEAYFRLEKIEHTARVIMNARLLGNVQVLSEEEVARLNKQREQLGIGGKQIRCVYCSSSCAVPGQTEAQQMVKTISDEVLKAIHG
jgi:L-fuculose-phosphate aldolase